MNRIEADHRRIVTLLVWLVVIVVATALALAATGYVVTTADDEAHHVIESYHLRTLNLTRKLNQDLDRLDSAFWENRPSIHGIAATVGNRIAVIEAIEDEAVAPGLSNAVDRLRLRFERFTSAAALDGPGSMLQLESLRLAVDQLEKLHLVESNELIHAIESQGPQRAATLAILAIGILIAGGVLFIDMYQSLQSTLRNQLQAETTLQLAEQRLRDAEKLQALGQLVGGIAHDFNNLLMVINGHLEVASQDRRLPPDAKASLRESLAAGTRASRLTRQLLAFARQQPLERRAENLNTLVAGVKSMLETLIEDEIELSVQLAPEPLTVEVDSSQLQQVLTNLILNARDAVSRGGRVLVSTSAVTVSAGDRREDVEPGRYCVITVADDGRGMDDATLKRAFEPFFTTKERGEGTGLGLSTVHGIVNQHGGYVRVFSQIDRGTRFEIYLPRAEERPLEVRDDVLPSNAGGVETLLLIEDEPQIRKLTATTLTGLGYTVHEAADGATALAISDANPGAIDLIVSDVIMPGMTGPETVEQILPAQPKAGVIYISGYTDDVVLRSGISAQNATLLEKPFKLDDLAQLVRSTLDERLSAVA